MVTFLAELHQAANLQRSFASAGGPWEFNLRDLLRWCDLAQAAVPANRYAHAVKALHASCTILFLAAHVHTTVNDLCHAGFHPAFIATALHDVVLCAVEHVHVYSATAVNAVTSAFAFC